MKIEQPGGNDFPRASLTQSQPRSCLLGLALTSSALLVIKIKRKLKPSKNIFQESSGKTVTMSTDSLCTNKVLTNRIEWNLQTLVCSAGRASICFSGRKQGKKTPITQELKAGASEQPALCKKKEQKHQRNCESNSKVKRLSILEQSSEDMALAQQRKKLKGKFCINTAEKGPAAASKTPLLTDFLHAWTIFAPSL